MMSVGQLMSWYHGKILRIPHGKQNPSKRYMTEEDILKLFEGTVVIEEKVDGKFSHDESVYKQYSNDKVSIVQLMEDMTGKNTCHEHVMEYKKLPSIKRIGLDVIIEVDGSEPLIFSNSWTRIVTMEYHKAPEIDEIYKILETLSSRKSIYGNCEIEGLVIKNFGMLNNVSPFEIIKNPEMAKRFEDEVQMGKWVNDKFEDKINA